MLLKRHALPPCRPGYTDYWAMVEVHLYKPIPVDGPDDDATGPVVGYIRNFGVRVKEGELQVLLERAIDDGKIRWDASECYPVNPDTLDRIVRKRIVPVDPGGIWYTSGRAFYPDETEDEPDPVQ